MGLKEDLKNIFGTFSDNIVKKLDEVKPKDVQVVIVKQNPNTFSSTILEKGTTTNEKWQNKDFPILKIENSLAEASKIEEITLIPNANFKTKGKVIITVDDSEVFQSKGFNAFENVIDTKLKINKTINQDSKVKLFMISSDGSAVAMTMQVQFGE